VYPLAYIEMVTFSFILTYSGFDCWISENVNIVETPDQDGEI